MSESTVDIKIVTRAELAGAEAAAKSLEVAIGKAKILGKDYSDLEKQLQKAKTAIAQFKATPPDSGTYFQTLNAHLKEIIPGLAKAEEVIVALGSGTLGVMAAGFMGVAAALTVVGKGLKEFAGVEEKVNSLDAALARSGQLTGAYREKLQAMADTLQDLTGINDEQWLGVMGKLTQFGANSSNIDKSVEAVKNLAGILDGDLQTAGMMVSKALQGNYEMFGRYGIKVDESGSQTEKLNQLFVTLAQIGGGQLEARAKGITGQFHQMTNALDDLFKGIGRGAAQMGIGQFLMSQITLIAKYWADAVGGTVEKNKDLENSSTTTGKSLADSAENIKKYGEAINGIKVASDASIESLNNLLAAKDKHKSAEDQISKANRERDLAKIDAQEKMGILKGPAAQAARNKINSDYDKADYERELKSNEVKQTILSREKSNYEEKSMQFEQAWIKQDANVRDALKAQSDRNKRLQPANKALIYWQSERNALDQDPSDYENSELGAEKGWKGESWKNELRRKIEAKQEPWRQIIAADPVTFDIPLEREKLKKAQAEADKYHEDTVKEREKLDRQLADLGLEKSTKTSIRNASVLTQKFKNTAGLYEARKAQNEALYPGESQQEIQRRTMREMGAVPKVLKNPIGRKPTTQEVAVRGAVDQYQDIPLTPAQKFQGKKLGSLGPDYASVATISNDGLSTAAKSLGAGTKNLQRLVDLMDLNRADNEKLSQRISALENRQKQQGQRNAPNF